MQRIARFHALLVACILTLGVFANARAEPVEAGAGGIVRMPGPVQKWGVIEITLAGPAGGNPFVDVELAGRFRQGDRVVNVPGFYDGDGVYKIRFMPDREGSWSYEVTSSAPALRGKTGRFDVVAAGAGNHGPVGVRDIFHFGYADGTPFHQIGTTSYAWTSQGQALEELTLKTLAAAPFNKLRMAVFPKRYEWNTNEPALYPFEGSPPAHWDFTRFNPAFFRHLEQRVLQLRELGIEADIILFHPYDKGHWGFDRMPSDADDRYLRYVVARLSALRNVWWSMANEYDFMKEKQPEDWDRFFQIVQAADPYQHLRSIHNGAVIYNHTKSWVTHVSIQSGTAAEDFSRAELFRDVYRKPVVFDEVKYEGDLPQRWGQLTPEEMVLRFWEGTIAGTYVGHGETYRDAHDVIWWAKGGTLHGQSPARLAFLRKILEAGPAELDPIDKWQDYPFAGKPGEYYLGYFGKQAPAAWKFTLYKKDVKEGMKFKAEVIDSWNMTITPVPGVFETKKEGDYVFVDKGGRSVPLPRRPYMAIRLTRVP